MILTGMAITKINMNYNFQWSFFPDKSEWFTRICSKAIFFTATCFQIIFRDELSTGLRHLTHQWTLQLTLKLAGWSDQRRLGFTQSKEYRPKCFYPLRPQHLVVLQLSNQSPEKLKLKASPMNLCIFNFLSSSSHRQFVWPKPINFQKWAHKHSQPVTYIPKRKWSIHPKLTQIKSTPNWVEPKTQLPIYYKLMI